MAGASLQFYITNLRAMDPSPHNIEIAHRVTAEAIRLCADEGDRHALAKALAHATGQSVSHELRNINCAGHRQ